MTATFTNEILADLRGRFGNTVKSADLYDYDPALCAAARKGGLMKVKRGLFSLETAGETAERVSLQVKSVEQIDEEIRQRFDALELLSDAIVAGNVGSMIVSGAAGVGKSYTLENKLAAAERTGKINITTLKGSISAIGLYMMLWENRERNDVLMLDDIDSIFGDEEAMNLLKGALDTNGRRVISWIKDSRFLADNDIPNSFEFKGRVVFLTNVDIQGVADKGNKMAPHMSALMSRSVFLDLGIHTPKEIMVRVKQVLAKTDMGLGLSAAQVQQIIDWLETHASHLRALSLRTVIQIAGFMKATPDWQLLARTTLLRTR